MNVKFLVNISIAANRTNVPFLKLCISDIDINLKIGSHIAKEKQF